MEAKEGSMTVSKTCSSYGKTKSHSFECEASGDIGMQIRVDGMEHVSYSQGFTKETKEWEFTRLEIELGCFVPDDLDAELAHKSIRNIVKALVNAEVDELNGVQSIVHIDGADSEMVNACFGRSITVSYGLTMKAANRDSEKVDASRKKYLSDGEDIIDAHSIVGAYIASIMEEEHTRVKGEK